MCNQVKSCNKHGRPKQSKRKEALKKITAPWLKNLVGYSYLLPKYHVQISREKNGRFLFISLLVKGYFTCKSMETGIIEGAIALIL